MKKLSVLFAITLLTLLFAGGTGDEARADGGGGTGPFVEGYGGVTPAGHEQGTPRTWIPVRACLTSELAIYFVERTAGPQEALDAFWQQMVVGGQCKYFPHGLTFWPEEVVAELNWGDGTPMYVVRGHDNMGVEVFTWTRASKAREFNIPPPGSSNVGLRVGGVPLPKPDPLRDVYLEFPGPI